MDALSLNTNTHLNSNIYWSMLKGLSKDIKLELISKLSASLITSKDTVEENADKFSTSYKVLQYYTGSTLVLLKKYCSTN